MPRSVTGSGRLSGLIGKPDLDGLSGIGCSLQFNWLAALNKHMIGKNFR